MNLKECCDASVAAFGFVYEAIEADKRFPDHLPIEAYISAHTEAMKLYMTSIINEAKGKSFPKSESYHRNDKPKEEPKYDYDEDRYSDTHCIKCDRLLTKKEVAYNDKNDEDYICYHCKKGS